MKKYYFLSTIIVFSCAVSCISIKASQEEKINKVWGNYNVGTVVFEDRAPYTEGSKIYNHIVTDVDAYIGEQARYVLSTLYSSPQDNVTRVDTILYMLEDRDGISAKGGSGHNVDIFYSTQYIEKAFADRDTTKLLFETRGVLLHELTHAYQSSPQGIGSYGTNRTFWAFIEGMADAVRVANGGFGAGARPVGGNYMDGYRTTGYFLVWLRDNKDSEFLRKFNRSTQYVIPWSFDGGVKYALGEEYNVDDLWYEYQVAVGDIKPTAKQ